MARRRIRRQPSGTWAPDLSRIINQTRKCPRSHIAGLRRFNQFGVRFAIGANGVAGTMFFFDMNDPDKIRKVRGIGTLIAALIFTFVFFAGIAYHQSFTHFSMQTKGKVVHVSKLEPACGGVLCKNPDSELRRYRYHATLDASFIDHKGAERQATLHMNEHSYDAFRHVKSIQVSYLPFAPQISFVGGKSEQLLWVLVASLVAALIALVMWAGVYYYEYIASDTQLVTGEAAYRRRATVFE